MRGDGNLKNAYRTTSILVLGRGLDLVYGRARYAQPLGNASSANPVFFKDIAILRKYRDMDRRGCSVPNHESRDTEV
jgi:hypothetical protein